METPTERRAVGLPWQVSFGVAFIAIGDGLAMMLPGTSGGVRGAVILAAGLVWLLVIAPRWMGWEAPRAVIRAIAALGVRIVPILGLVMAAVWYLATPEALNPWFAVAWVALFAACLAASRA